MVKVKRITNIWIIIKDSIAESTLNIIFAIIGVALLRTRFIDGDVKDVCTVAHLIAERILECSDNMMALVFRTKAFSREGPYILVTSNNGRLFTIELLVELEVQTILEVAASIGVRDNGFIVCVGCIDNIVFVPSEIRLFIVPVADIFFLYRGHLILPNTEDELLNL